MNRIYRSVWNEITRTFVAAAETVRGRGKPSSGVCADAAMAPASRSSCALERRRPLPLALEQRFMFDGAAAATAADAAASAAAAEAAAAIAATAAPVEVRAADAAANDGKTEVVFVDTSVADYKTLEAGIRDGVAIVEIDGAKDGLAQIARWAQTHSGYDSISILGHGSQATLNLGTTTLTATSLAEPTTTVRSELATIGGALTADGDLMLYGCDVAKGTEGEAFIAELAKATGADVAASDDATGAAAKGGDWALEKTVGSIESSASIADTALISYTGLLANVTFDFDTGVAGLGSNTVTATESGGHALTVTTTSDFGRSGLNEGFGVLSGADSLLLGEYSYETKAQFSVDSGSTFTLASISLSDLDTGFEPLIFTSDKGTITINLTPADPNANGGQGSTSTYTFDVTANANAAYFQGITWFTITTSAPGFDVLIDNVVVNNLNPPTLSSPGIIEYSDDKGDETFYNKGGVLAASVSAVTSSPIAAYGLSGGTAGAFDVGGSSYTVSASGSCGTLYLNEQSGAYVYVPNDAAIEALSTETVGGYGNRVTKSDRFTVTATDSLGATATNEVWISITGQNDTPEVTSGDSETVAENGSGTVYQVAASDRDSGQTLTYKLSGTDAGSFNINASTGAVSFKAAPDYENPADSDLNNVYDITVTATDDAAKVNAFTPNNDSAPKAVAITVTDADEAPVLSSAATASVAENGAAGSVVYTAAASDPEGKALTYSVAGADAAAFTIDATSGELKINAAADYETKSSYSIRIAASDGNLVATKDVTINVTEVNDKPVITVSSQATQNVVQGKSTPITGFSVADPDADTGVISVTLSATGGTFTATVPGNMSVSYNGTSAIILNGSQATINQLIAAGNVSYTSAAGASGDVTITIGADDYRSGGMADGQTLTLKIVVPNAAPVLKPDSPSFVTISEKDTGNAGQTVASLVGASISDANVDALQGIAITGLVSGNGIWQYRTDDGGSWVAVGTVDNSSALLLRATDKLRFVPNGVSGTTASITYRAWDQTSGVAGDKVSTASNGDETAFSTATDSASIAVSDVNDKPTAVLISNAKVSTLDSDNTVVGTLLTTDVDDTTWTYTIVSVDSSSSPSDLARFAISGSTLVATLPSALSPTTHRVVVRATDAGGLSCDQELSIKADDALTVTTATNQAYDSGKNYTALNEGGLSLAEAIGFANEHTGVTTIRFADGLGTLAGDVALTRTLTLDFGSANAATLSGAISIGSGATLIVKNDAGSVTLSGAISGDGALAKQGVGTLTLAGANTYAGQTTVAAGTLSTSGVDQLADNSNVEVKSGATLALGGNETIASLSGGGTVVLGFHELTVNETSDTTFSGVISGGGTLTKSGSGTLTLTGANTYRGMTCIEQGTLTLSGGATLADSLSVRVASNATLRVSTAVTIGSLVGNGSVSLDGSTLTVDSKMMSTTFEGVISGSGELVKTGSNTLTLTGANIHTGGTTLRDGTLSVAGAANLGAGVLTFDDGTLKLTSAASIGNAIALTGSGTLNSDVTTTLSGSISGNGALIKTGSGRLSLSGANSYKGTTTVSGGTLAIANDANLGAGLLKLADATTLLVSASTLGHAIEITGNATIDSSSSLTLSGTISGTGNLVKTGSGMLTLSGANSYSGTTVTAGVLAVAGDANLGGGTVSLAGGTMLTVSAAATVDNAITLSGNATISNAGALTLTGIISGSGRLLKQGGGTLTLAGGNSYSGGTDVNYGTLAAAGDTALGSGTVSLNNGAKLALNGTTAISNAIAFSSNSTIEVASGATATLSGPINGYTSTLTKAGAGTLTLAGNLQVGKLAVSAGTLATGHAYDLASVGVEVGAGATFAPGGGARFGALSGGGAIELGSYALEIGVDNSTSTFVGTISGSGSLVKSGNGTLTLTGNNTYTGRTQVSGGTLAIAGGSAIADSSLVAVMSGSFLIVNESETIGALSGAGTVSLSASTLTVGGDLATEFSGIISGNGGALTKTGSATLTLSGANTYTGTTTVSGGTLALGAGGTLGTGDVSLATGTKLDVYGTTTLANAVTLAGSAIIYTDTALTLDGVVGGSGALTKTGSGTLTLGGANSYTGTTTVSGGTLAIAGDGNLGTGALTISGGTLKLTSAATIDNAITVTGNATLDAADALTLSGTIDGAGSLSKIGSGSLRLVGSNSYQGTTTVSAGLLSIDNDANLGTGSVSLAAGTKLSVGQATTIDNAIELTGTGNVTFSNSAALTLSGAISGSGGLLKQTPATLTLTGNNSYSGETIVNYGTLAVAGDANLGTGKLTLRSNAMLAVSGTTTINNAIELAGDAAVDIGAETTLSGAIDAYANTLTKSGAGTLILAGSTARIGETVVAGGTLRVDTALDGSVSAQTGATVCGSGSVSETLTIDSGATLAPGAAGVGTLTVNNTLTLNGTLAIEVSGDTSYDRIVAKSGVILGANSAISVTRVGGYTRSGTPDYTLISGATNASGGFSGIAQGGALQSGGDVYTVSYAGGCGHDLVLAGWPVPAVTAVNATTPDGAYKAGTVIDIVVSFDHDVSVSGGVPTLLLETGATDRAARYLSGSGSKTLHFSYTVQAGDNSADLDYVSGATLQLNGATLRDTYGQDAALAVPTAGGSGSIAANRAIVIDTSAPTIGFGNLALSADSGSITDFVTNSAAQTISATLDSALETGDTVWASLDNGASWTDITAKVSGTALAWDGVTLAGSNTLRLKVIDRAGNEGAARSQSYVLDTAAPAVGAPRLAAGSDSGASASDRLTRITTPTVTGSAEAGSTVTLHDGGSVLGTAIADASGNWTIDCSTLSEGAHALTATAADAAGNVSAASAALTIAVDTTAPNAPSAPILAAASDSGSSASDQLTRVTTPTVTGSAAAGSSVTLYDSDSSSVLGSATADAAGQWTIVTSPLAEGAHTLAAKATDTAGNASAASGALAIVVDTLAPASPIAPTLVATSDSGVSSDGVTNNTAPTISGSAEANTTVRLYDGATLLGSTTADGSGAWAFTCSTLAEGAHTLTASATDAAGNASAASAALALVIDTQAGVPSALTLAGKAGNATNSTTPTIAGSAEAGSTVALYDGGTLLGSASADASGRWSFTCATLTEGAHTLTAKATDPAGNASAASAALVLTIDTAAPASPAMLALASASDSGASGSDRLTRVSTPIVSGTAEALSTVTLYDSDGATVLGSATADGSGAWTITSSTLADGAHTLTARATDAAGNVSGVSNDLAFTIDTSAPASPATLALALASDSGASGSDGVTVVTAPILSGTAEAFSTVTLYDGQIQLGSANADGTGVWTFTCPTLADGAHTLTARATDAAGNVSAVSAALAVTIDTSAPASPATLALAAASDSGVSGNDRITRVSTPTLTGTAEAFSTVTLYEGNTQLGSATADSAGAWTITSSTLTAGAHTLTARATDAAGNVSAVSAALAVTIDTSAPASPATLALAAASDSGVSGNDRITRVSTPTLTGTAEAFSTVTLYEGNTQLGSATADSAGAWTITSSTLTAGAHTLTARATDAAGNVSGVSNDLAFTIDTSAPASPATLALAAASDSGVSGSDRITRVSTPTLTGTAEAFSTVTLYDSDGTTVLGSARADGSGAWTITSSTLTDGAHTLTARATDAAGNVSAVSAALAVTIDTSAPAAPLLATSSGNKTSPTISGSAEALSTVTLYDGQTQLGSATADGAGAWSIACPTLAVGAHMLTARATDVAGNVSSVASPLSVSIEASVPPPVIATPAVVIPAAVTTTTTAAVGSDVATSTASFLAPTSELASGAESGALTALATGTTSATTTASLGSALSSSLAASFSVAQTGTAPSAALGSSAAAPVTGLAPAAGEARSSSATVVLTQSAGFQVVVASGGSAAAGDGIVVNRGVSDQSVPSGTVTQFAIPADAFAASNVGAVVTLFVRQSDGRPLPGWLHFNAANGSFEGQPPPGYTGEISIRVTARDAQGHEAVTTFKVKVGGRSANGDGQRAQPERAARAGLAEQLRLAARTHPALERLARLAGWRDAA